MDKGVLADGLCSENSGKKKYIAPGMKAARPQKVENNSEEVIASSVEMQ